MKVLVTGGAGFIGSHVAQAYLDEGHEVVVLDDLSGGKRENVPDGARLEVMDIRDQRLAAFVAAERFEAVNHHAAQISVPYSVEAPAFDAQVNVLGLINLLEAARAAEVGRFIFISSGGAVYGEVPRPPADESTPARPLSPYAVSKRAGELYVAFYSQTYGFGAVTLRYANVYGPRQIPHGEAGVVAIFMDKVLGGQAPVIYRYEDMPRGMVRDYVYVGDCARANVLALTQGQGIYNIGTSVGSHTLDLWEAVQKAGGSELEHSYGPARPGDLRQSILDASHASDELGWRPRYDLAHGIRETWAWRKALG